MACVTKCFYDHKLPPETKKLEKSEIDKVLLLELQNSYREGIGLHTEPDLKPQPVTSLISLAYPQYKDYTYTNYEAFKKDYFYFEKTIESGGKAKYMLRSKYRDFWIRVFKRTDSCILDGEKAEVSSHSEVKVFVQVCFNKAREYVWKKYL